MSSPRLAPVLKGEDHSELVVNCPPHALPFGVIFDEYKARREEYLVRSVEEVYVDAGSTEMLSLLKPFEMDNSRPGRAEAQAVLGFLHRRLEERNKDYQHLHELKQQPEPSPIEIDQVEKKCHDSDSKMKLVLHRMESSAVCLSGGGIRSASFCLGVLQSLARFSEGLLHPRQGSQSKTPGMLGQLDYLSTVSGGGYIGSWLTAWIYRRSQSSKVEAAEQQSEIATLRKKAILSGFSAPWESMFSRPVEILDTFRANVKARLSSQKDMLLQNAKDEEHEAARHLEKIKKASWQSAYRDVVSAMAGQSNLTSGDPAPQPIRHLRDYTAYLAPKTGASLDAWDLAAIVTRNLLLNWLMIIPLVLAAVALVQVSHAFSTSVQFAHLRHHSAVVFTVSVLLYVVAAVFAGRNLPSHRNKKSDGPGFGQVMAFLTAPVMVANWLWVHLWRTHQKVELLAWSRPKFFLVAVCFLGFILLACSLYFSYRRKIPKDQPELASWRKFVLMSFEGIIVAVVTAEIVGALFELVFPKLVLNPKPPLWMFHIPIDDRLFTVFAFPLLSLALLLSVSLFSGLVGIYEDETDREWWSRVGGMQLAVLAFWIIANIIVLYGTEMHKAIWAVVGGAIMGGLSSWAGFSGATSAGTRPLKTAQVNKAVTFLNKYGLLLPTISLIAILLIAFGAAAAELHLQLVLQKTWISPMLQKIGISVDRPSLLAHFSILIAALILALLINWAININLFSLHGMYRMRLMRAFLGASNPARRPDRFTNFDPRDTPSMSDLPCAHGVPLHVVNTTLNLTSTQNLSWQQRKAEPFTFNALYAGSWRLGYVPTSEYAGDKGVTLATAMAISGAAFNPNMGYHSSPLVTLLMTLFNVRLGWWLPNPARENGGWYSPAKGARFLHMSGPTLALMPLIREALGMTNDKDRWIELTDGGHFENLGLYEMVLRRCHNIIVVDAGADPECQFEDLGNALRKIEIDLGIPIRFDGGLHMKKGAQPDNHYCAVAKIDYGCVDANASMTDEERSALAGTLVYIKAGIRGTEPPDITQYASTHKTFPHETTANQFFNEAQFESYRHLGAHIVEVIVGEGAENLSSDVSIGRDFTSFNDLMLGHADTALQKTRPLALCQI